MTFKKQWKREASDFFKLSSAFQYPSHTCLRPGMNVAGSPLTCTWFPGILDGVFTSFLISFQHTHEHTHRHTHTHKYAHTHTYTHAHIHTYRHTHIRTHIHIHTYTHTHAYRHTCTHIQTHTHIHTYIHTHIHTHINTHAFHGLPLFGWLDDGDLNPAIKLRNQDTKVRTVERKTSSTGCLCALAKF